MKVLVVTREYPPFEVGGVAVHAYNLVNNLRQLGVSCKVLSFGDEKRSNHNIRFINPSSSIIERFNTSLASDIKIPADIVYYSRIANRMLKQEDFDIVHVEEPYMGAFIGASHNLIKVSTFHDTSFGEIKSMGSPLSTADLKRLLFFCAMGFFLEFKCIASSNELIVPTSQVRDELSKIYRTSKKISIIRNGVELPQLVERVDKAEAKQKLGLNPESILIFTIARIVSRKRLDLLVNAVNILCQEKPSNFQVIIAGNGPDRINILNLVKRCRLENIIKLPGWISDEQKHLYYQAADIFVLTSSYEGFPLTMLEAMSYGVAIVASRIQSLTSLRNGLDALLFSTGEPHSLSDIIYTLLNDPSLRTRLSHSARLFAETCSWENVAQETKYLYERLLDAKSRS